MKKMLAATLLLTLTASMAMARDGVVVHERDEVGNARFISGQLGQLKLRGGLAAKSDIDREWAEAAREFVRNNSAELFAAAGNEDVVAISSAVDELGLIRVRMQESINGLRVVGGDIVLHADASTGVVRSINGLFARGTDLPTVPTIDAELALARAATQARIRNGEMITSPELSYVVNEKGAAFLAWSATYRYENVNGEQIDVVFAEANQGDLVARHPKVHSAMNRKTYTSNNGTSLPGTLLFNEGGSSTNTAAMAAYNNGGVTYNYYWTKHSRDSYDGAGAIINQTVNYSSRYNNAFWNGSQMVYGDGDGTTFTSLAMSLDVVAHELTHAVTERSAGLVYQNESGALNEGMSDIFGAATEIHNDGGINSATWLIGDEIYTPGTAGDALRYMHNPTQDGSSKDYYPERYVGTSDNGGVHWNSGIANLAFKLLVTGGSHPRSKTTVVVPALGIAQAEKIFYRALTSYMTSSTNFQGARNATASAATDLYGATANAAVHKAWDAVGVPGGVTPPATVTTVTNNQTTSSISASTGAWKQYKITVPSGQSSLKVTTTGGTGDGDLFVKLGSSPTSASYNAKSETGTNAETVTITNPAAGDWYIGIYAYATFSGMSMTPVYTGTVTPPACTSYTGSLTGSGTNSYKPSTTGFTANAGIQTGKLTGTGADFDLYLQKLSGTTWSNVASGTGATSTENVSYNGTAGTYRWRVYSYSGSGTFSLCTTKP